MWSKERKIYKRTPPQIRTLKELAKQENTEVSAVYFDIKKCFDKMVLKEAVK